ncbi:MAG TPA: IS4 family transposase [Phycisphaerae bacterium]|nr:IS4 family transposase [Phycisphaerae bacterium]
MEAIETPRKVLDGWAVVRRLLPDGWEMQARALGALQRARNVPNARVLLRVLLLHLAGGCSLAETAARAKQAGWCQLTGAAVFWRLRAAEHWLRWMTEHLWHSGRELPPVGARRFLAVDASTVTETGPTGSQWRLHYALNFANLRCEFTELTDIHGGETFRRFPLRRGDVVLGDRAYGTPPGVAHAVRAGADVLVRTNLSNLPLHQPGGGRFASLTRLRCLRVGRVRDWPVEVHTPDGVRTGRLVALKKSRRAARAARRVLWRRARKTGQTLQRSTLEAASYLTLFTTLPAAEFPAERIAEWYRLRWQIELAFKRLKSLLNYGQLPKHDPACSRAWLYGKLLVALLVERLITEAETLSPWGYPLAPTPQPLA